MKVKSKKSLLFLILILVAPIFLLVGCGEVQSYNITATTNCQNGNVTGMGSFNDGSRVTLTARGVNNHRFIAWVYQNKTILVNNNTYDIETSSDSLTSTLTFNASSYTADNYTAIFEDSRQMYYTLSSYRVVEHAEGEEIPEENLENQNVTCVGNLSISIGENVLNYRTPVNLTNQSFLNTTTNFTDMRDVFRLTSQPYYVRFTFSSNEFTSSKTIALTYGNSSEQDEDGVEVDFQTNGDIVLTYSFDMTKEETTDGEEGTNDGEAKMLTSLILTLCPLRAS